MRSVAGTVAIFAGIGGHRCLDGYGPRASPVHRSIAMLARVRAAATRDDRPNRPCRAHRKRAGPLAAGAWRRWRAQASFSRKRWIFPVGVFGRASVNRTERGYL